MPKKSGITWQLTFFSIEIPLKGKERRRRNRCLVACLCVAGVLLLCGGSNALIKRCQCPELVNQLDLISKLT